MNRCEVIHDAQMFASVHTPDASMCKSIPTLCNSRVSFRSFISCAICLLSSSRWQIVCLYEASSFSWFACSFCMPLSFDTKVPIDERNIYIYIYICIYMTYRVGYFQDIFRNFIRMMKQSSTLRGIYFEKYVNILRKSIKAVFLFCPLLYESFVGK